MTYSAEVLTDTPLVYWRLGDASGTTMTDSSGNSRDGTYVNTPTLGATGLISGDSDKGVGFDGANDYAHIADAAWMDVTAITVEALIKPATTGLMSIIDRDNGTTERMFQFRKNASDKLEAIVWRTSDGPFFLAGATTLTAGGTYHCAMKYDGATSTWKLLVNGVVDASTALAGSLKTGAYNVVVGASSSGGTLGGTALFNGTIDEVAYYGAALSDARLAAHSAAAIPATAAKRQPGTFRQRAAVIRAAHY